MTEYERTTVPLRPEQKAALKEADRPMSEIVRELVEGWRKHGATQEVFEEELEKEIELIDTEIETKERRKEQKQEQLERLRDNSLTPADRETVEEFLDRDFGGLVMLNPHFHLAQDESTATLSPEELLKEAAKRADSLEPLDRLVMEYRRKGLDKLTTENAPAQRFGNQFAAEPRAEFVVDLIEIRNEALEDNNEKPDENAGDSSATAGSIT